MKPLSVRIMQWADVPQLWRDALNTDDTVSVLFVPEGRDVAPPPEYENAASVPGGTVYAFRELRSV